MSWAMGLMLSMWHTHTGQKIQQFSNRCTSKQMTTYLINLKAFCHVCVRCDALLYVARSRCLRYVPRFSQSRPYFLPSVRCETKFAFLDTRFFLQKIREKLFSKNRFERTCVLQRLTNRFVVDLHAVCCAVLFVPLWFESFWLYIDELILFCRTHIYISFRATINGVGDVDDGKSIKTENCYVL